MQKNHLNLTKDIRNKYLFMVLCFSSIRKLFVRKKIQIALILENVDQGDGVLFSP